MDEITFIEMLHIQFLSSELVRLYGRFRINCELGSIEELNIIERDIKDVAERIYRASDIIRNRCR